MVFEAMGITCVSCTFPTNENIAAELRIKDPLKKCHFHDISNNSVRVGDEARQM